ncbi:hypothetical protein CR205_09255 [Alteribacter lacisalsi]|uniref:Uncharacterized protein n=2 Tax=Alteribacter lacisalsi TaxID=2045244 RepID=A0A2W0HBG2_9BACI|nr:hypothetical protein CR205_09255 [Alteribacter lacisalsi]
MYETPEIQVNQYDLVEDFAWFLVFIAVLLALGATVVLGAAVWCLANGNGSFTGGTQWDSGLRIWIECR